MDKLPGLPGARRARTVVEHLRKPGLRGRSLRRRPLGSRAPRGEDTSEPIPRPLPGASGAVRSANGRVDSPIHPQKPNQKTIWFGFCFALIFNTHAHLDIARSQALPPPRRAQKGTKRQKNYLSRRSFSGDGSMPTRHGVERREQALTRSRKPLFLSANSCQGH